MVTNRREYDRNYYASNRDKMIAKRKAYYQRTKFRPDTKAKRNATDRKITKRLRDYVFSLKIGKSCKCGFSDPRALVWHHVDPASKTNTIARLCGHKSLKKLQAEIAKCVLVCCNCHAIEHHPEMRIEN